MVQRREICFANWLHANEAELVRWKHRSMRWLSVPEASLAVAGPQRRATLSLHEIQIWVFIYRCMIPHFVITCTSKLTRVVDTNNTRPSPPHTHNFQKNQLNPDSFHFFSVLVWFHVIFFFQSIQHSSLLLHVVPTVEEVVHPLHFWSRLDFIKHWST